LEKKMVGMVFISYPSEDGTIADSVYKAIDNIPNRGLEAFLDRIHIEGGGSIPRTIKDALKETVYFVAIGTDVVRRNFDWCGLELGLYEASHPDDSKEPRTCLYHEKLPDLFADRRSYKVQALTEDQLGKFGTPVVETKKSQFYNFLMDVAKKNADLNPAKDPATYWADVSVWAGKYSKLITDSFVDRVKETWYPQGRLQLSISRGGFFKDTVPRIPLDSWATMAVSTYPLFGAGRPSEEKTIGWREFVSYIKDKTGSDTLTRIISDVVVSALPDKEDADNDYVFQAPNGRFYRVLVAQHSVYGDEKREILINIVRTLNKKMESGDPSTTTLVTLASGLVIGSKYRSMFLETGANYDDVTLKNLSDDALVKKLIDMLRDIDRISADAASEGLADYTALQELLGNTDEIKSLFEK
jgi:hypothetical protein